MKKIYLVNNSNYEASFQKSRRDSVDRIFEKISEMYSAIDDCGKDAQGIVEVAVYKGQILGMFTALVLNGDITSDTYARAASDLTNSQR